MLGGPFWATSGRPRTASISGDGVVVLMVAEIAGFSRLTMVSFESTTSKRRFADSTQRGPAIREQPAGDIRLFVRIEHIRFPSLPGIHSSRSSPR
jgi:hypothetical protein